MPQCDAMTAAILLRVHAEGEYHAKPDHIMQLESPIVNTEPITWYDVVINKWSFILQCKYSSKWPYRS